MPSCIGLAERVWQKNLQRWKLCRSALKAHVEPCCHIGANNQVCVGESWAGQGEKEERRKEENLNDQYNLPLPLTTD